MKKQWILVLVLLCCLNLAACGAANIAEDDSGVPTKADALTEIAKIYLATQMGLDADAAALGGQLAVFRLSEDGLEAIDHEMYPVFHEGEIVAFARGFLSDAGEYVTGCAADFAEAFQKELDAHPDKPVAVVYARGGVYLVREGEEAVPLREMPQAGLPPIGELERFRDSLTYALVREE